MHGLTPLFPSDPLPQLQLPCGHEYCKSCVEELRQKGVDRSCPLCRKPLPPGPDKLFDLGSGMYWKIRRAIERSRPGVDWRTPWPALSGEQQREMDEARAMLREAADQGHMEAQFYCGDLYDFGRGVAKDDRLAMTYYKKAAQQGDKDAQYNAGVNYRDGIGCEQSFERAAEMFEKAAHQGDAEAINELGRLHYHGQFFPQNYKRALELYRKSSALGNPVATHNLGWCHEFGRSVPQNHQEALRLYTLASERGCECALKALGRVQAAIRDDPSLALTKQRPKKPKPNQPCSCGSGKKHKKCCGASGTR